MRKILAASFLLFVAACNPSTPTPTPIPLADCAFTADGPTTIYTRPSLTADVFYEAPAGFTISEFQARTSDGWLGFDPGIAQAANTGPFRLRWIPPSAGTFSGDCSGLPVVWGPPPGVCFLMPMGLVDVHDMPDAAASVIDTLTVDDYVAIDGMNAAGWAHVDFSPGNTGLSLAGWVAPADLNMNGPCDFTPPPACAFSAAGPTTIYTRPSLTADVFYEAPAGFTISEFQAQTSDGWLGFDPGIAQAANTGPFRLRWIPPTAATLSGDCSGLPVVWGPPPGVCFLMPMGPVDVHDMPDAAASVINTLTVDDYVAIDGVNAGGWAHVDFAPGNTGASLTGWVAPADLNMNGPCDFSATPTPVGAAISGFTPDTTQVYSGLGRCTPEQVTFNAHVADPSAVKVVVFFYRLQDVDSGEQSDWSTGQAMQQQGSGYYSLTLTGSELVGSSGFTHAHVRYQFALQPKSGAIVRSSVYDDVELAQCGIISLPALILVTPTPTPIIVK
jgi:sarcosine oxidase gamma subunit